MKRLRIIGAFVATMAATLLATAVPAQGTVSTRPVTASALAAGSVINIGATIRDGNLIKGSGSWTNNGDWTSACVRIMIQYTSQIGQPKKQLSIACRTGTGSATWGPYPRNLDTGFMRLGGS
jgi:hypothetical protein